MLISRWLVLILYWLLTLAAHAAPAVNSAPELFPDGQSYERRRWTQADGAPQQGLTIAQTDDGLLWFASAVGLYSFDGVHFRKVSKVYGHDLLSTNVMYAGKVAGGLIVGYYFGGISIFTPERVIHYRAGQGLPYGSVMAISIAKDGTIYAATGGGLAMLRNGRWQLVGQDSLPKGYVRWVDHDLSGRLWVDVASNYYVRPLDSQRFVPVPVSVSVPMQSQLVHWRRDGLYALLPGQDLQVLEPQSATPPAGLDHAQLYLNPPMQGPDGTEWAGRADGLVRLVRGKDNVLRAAELFTGNISREEIMHRALADREGNFWVVTSGGVERFRRHRFHRLETPGSSFHWLAQRGLGEELWLGALRYPLVRIKADGSRQQTTLDTPSALLRLGPDNVWVGSAGLWQFHGQTQQHWALPPGLAPGADIQALAAEGDGRLLVSIARHGLWTFANGEWRQDPRLQGLDDPTPISMLTDAGGRTWLGLTRNRLLELTAGAARPLAAGAGLQVGNVYCLQDFGGKLLVGGDHGVAWVDGGRAHVLKLQGMENLDRVTGLVLDRQGSLWIHSNDGLHRVKAQALAQFWQMPAQALEAELFNFEDGVSGMAPAARPLPSLALAQDGRLYYATVTKVGWIDPATIPRNERAPTVLLQSLRTPAREYLPAGRLVLPQQTTSIELAFTATALSIPERVRLKFRLDGVDRGWREAGRERSAQYTNLAPGSYRFHVIAANEDGVWNTEGAQFRFEIEPAFWQTGWFHLACALAALAAGVLLYRWRIGVIERRAEQHAALRAEATLQERSRIARSLHDNLLQAVQALLLRFHLVEQKLAKEPELQSMVGSALDYAESVVAITRDEVMELRRAQDADELFAALRHAASQAAPGDELRLSCTIVGQPRPLRADSCAELASVLREAVLNSVAHAEAQHIEVRLTFRDDSLLAEVRDDGVGLDAAVALHGKSGHWGIPGMRERIGRLGGQIEIASAGKGGVAVSLSIPAQQAYA